MALVKQIKHKFSLEDFPLEFQSYILYDNLTTHGIKVSRSIIVRFIYNAHVTLHVVCICNDVSNFNFHNLVIRITEKRLHLGYRFHTLLKILLIVIVAINILYLNTIPCATEIMSLPCFQVEKVNVTVCEPVILHRKYIPTYIAFFCMYAKKHSA